MGGRHGGNTHGEILVQVLHPQPSVPVAALMLNASWSSAGPPGNRGRTGTLPTPVGGFPVLPDLWLLLSREKG